MKKLTIFHRTAGVFALLCLTITLFAQSPKGFTYQAVARDSNDDPLSNMSLIVHFSILDGAEQLVWKEQHSVVTNDHGLFSQVICNEDADKTGGSAGSLNDIIWGASSHELKIEVDDGSTVHDMGTNPFMAVPYALFAINAGDSGGADEDPQNELQNLQLNGTDLSISDGNLVDLSVLQDGIEDADSNPNNEIQDLQITGSELSITNNVAATPIDLSSFNESNVGWTRDGTDNVVYVNGNVGVGTVTPEGRFSVQGVDESPEEPLFMVQRKDGYPVFAVYEHGVYAFTDTVDTGKGIKGGFAVGGYKKLNKGIGEEYMRVTADSIRFYVNQDENKGIKGGFAVGGYKKLNKGPANEFLRITPDSVRIYIDDDPNAKGIKGGFAVGGYKKLNKGEGDQYFNISTAQNADIIMDERRIAWYPTKDAFLAGTVHIGSVDSVGSNSAALGYKNIAMGQYSQAFGFKTSAFGNYSLAVGDRSVAQGASSVAVGYSNFSSQTGSASFGYDNTASGTYSFASGNQSNAAGSSSVAIGYSNFSSATGSSTFGWDNTASNSYSFAAGNQSAASGNSSVAIGYSNLSTATGSSSFGYDNTASNLYAFAAGRLSTASGHSSIAIGYGNTSSGTGSASFGAQNTATGNYSLAVGYKSAATYEYSYAIGEENQAKKKNSFAFGRLSIADNVDAFAFGVAASSTGQGAYAFGAAAQAVGAKSYAFGEASHTAAYGAYAFGSNAKAYGTGSHAIGTHAIANSQYSIALGYDLHAGASGSPTGWQYAIALGKFNNTSVTTPLLVVGNGTSNGARSNALVLQTNGELGIGIDNPLDRLHVNGNIRFTGNLIGQYGTVATSISEELNINYLGAHSLGTKVSGALKVTGEIIQGTNDYGSYQIQTPTRIYAGDYIVALGGVHVGGTSNPGTDNLIVDGDATVSGGDLKLWYGTKALQIRQDGSSTYISNKANFVSNGSTNNGAITINGQGGVYLSYGTAGSAGTTGLALSTLGNVGIGISNPGVYRLFVNGVTFSSSGYIGSDRKFKENINLLVDPIEALKRIQGVSYKWKRDQFPDKQFPEGQHFGVIAQEIEKVFPDLVMEGPSGELAVSYTEFIPILIEAVKDQQDQIDEQQIVIAKKDSEIDDLRFRLEKIEAHLELK